MSVLRSVHVLVAAAALVAAAQGCTADREEPGAETVPEWRTELPTSDWSPGDAAMLALGSGRLGVDADGCPYLAPAVDEPIGYTEVVPRMERHYVVWPAGWTATETDDAELELRAPDGSVVATTGDVVQGGRGFVALSPELHSSCIPREKWDEVFYLQDGLEIVS